MFVGMFVINYDIGMLKFALNKIFWYIYELNITYKFLKS